MESVPVEDHEVHNLDQNTSKDSADKHDSEFPRKIVFQTRSLAEVYAQQGHVSIALEIYRRMQQRNPSDGQVAERMTELEARLGSRRRAKPKPDASSQGDSTE